MRQITNNCKRASGGKKGVNRINLKWREGTTLWCEGTTLERVLGERRVHFMLKLNQSLKCKDQEIQTCSSNQRQFKGLDFSFPPSSKSPLNLNWKSEFPCFLYRVQCISGQ